MDDENGLELSLGLGCGGSSSKSKGKNDSSSDNRTEEGDRGSKLVGDFKDFLHAGILKQDSVTSSQRSNPVKPQENFFNDLCKVTIDAEASINLNGRGLWVANNNRSTEIEEEKKPETSNKRRMLFDEINHQKKRDREAEHVDVHDKDKMPHISVTTDDGSTAENEDVAESEIEGSTSRPNSHCDDGSKRFIGVGGSSEVPKEVRMFGDSGVLDLQGQKRFNSSSENEFKVGNLTYSVPCSIQSVNMMNVPYSLSVKESNSVGATSTPRRPLPGMMQVMPTANDDDERSGIQTMNPGNLPLLFGYSPAQLPTLDKDNSRGLVSHPPQFHPSYDGRAPPNSAAMQVIPLNPSEATQNGGTAFEGAKGDGKQLAMGEGSSSQTEDVKGSSLNFRAKNASDRSAPEGLSLDFSAIKPGIAADLKFGGSGSYPNLPWVSATAPGPNGRTISGVTYRYNANQIRIVCACHGSHMSPEEFVLHAGEENINPDGGTVLATFPSNNPAASAQS